MPPELLSFVSFNMEKVLKFGAPLLSSAGKEYDVELEGMDHKERLAHQRKSLGIKLGMGNDIGMAVTMEEIVGDEDFTITSSRSEGSDLKRKWVPSLLVLVVFHSYRSQSLISVAHSSGTSRTDEDERKKKRPPKWQSKSRMILQTTPL